jgi:hypothetical protein
MRTKTVSNCLQKFFADSQFSLLTTLPLTVADVDFLIPMFTGKAKLQDAAQFVAYPMQSFQNHIRAAGATGGLHGNCMKHDRGDSSGLSLMIPNAAPAASPLCRSCNPNASYAPIRSSS